jgi:hypothetical protein
MPYPPASFAGVPECVAKNEATLVSGVLCFLSIEYFWAQPGKATVDSR